MTGLQAQVAAASGGERAALNAQLAEVQRLLSVNGTKSAYEPVERDADRLVHGERTVRARGLCDALASISDGRDDEPGAPPESA